MFRLKKSAGLGALLALLVLVLMLGAAACSSPEPTPPEAAGGAEPPAAPASQGGQAQTPAADIGFYDGKILNFIVATKAGGGYDGYARLVAPFLQKYLPGSTVVVKNVPGAGHLIGANEVYAAKPDGLTIGTFNTALIYSQLVGAEGVRFDLTKYTWIAKMAGEERVFMVGVQTPYQSIAEVINADPPVKLSSAGISSASHTDALILQDALGLKIELIPGYSGEEGEMAILRGEVDGTIGTYSSLKPFMDNGDGRVLLQIGRERHPDLAEVPLATELVKPEKKALVDLLTAMSELGRLVAAPPEVPAERAQALIQAFQKSLSDPELQQQAAKAEMPLKPLYGEEVAQLIRDALNQPPENLEKLKDILAPTLE